MPYRIYDTIANPNKARGDFGPRIVKRHQVGIDDIETSRIHRAASDVAIRAPTDALFLISATLAARLSPSVISKIFARR
jgi:hypothetical protein